MIQSAEDRRKQKLIQLTNNSKYDDFKDFRKVESKRDAEANRDKVGQSERAVMPISATAEGPVLLYRNSQLEKDPIERRKLIADKIVDDSHQKLRQRVISYRNMLKNPEVSEIVENIANEAITDNGRGQVISLAINDRYPGVAIGDISKNNLQQDFSNVMQTIFNFNEVAKNVFIKFLVEGAQFWEVCYNKEKNKITGVNHLPSYNMLVIIDDGVIVGFRQIIDNEYGGINIDKAATNNGRYTYKDYSVNQILWWDYQSWGMGGINDRQSYLEPAKKFVNVLGNLEDSYAKYIITRGTEKLVYYISTGKMPPPKAEEHLQRQANVLNRKVYYNGDEGTILGSERIQAMSESIFVPVPDGTSPSKIDVLPAGTNIGEITPLNYFREKIYQALKYPRSRSRMNTQQAQPASIGKPGEIDVEQVILTRFIENMQASFGKVLIDLFIMYLETRPEYDDKIKDPKLYQVTFEQSNVFKMIKESEMINMKLDILAKASEFLADFSGGPKDILAKELVLKDFCQMSDEQYSKNLQLRDKELVRRLREKERLEEINKETQTLNVPEGGGSGFGGDEIGGSELGGIGGAAPLEAPMGEPGGEEAPATEPENSAPNLELPSEK
ncbi:MAG: portal protein [Candidatus Omnitrophica bacterium]|jgi:hypothetical protein|nr:portal protein [Candidatus Omnitrophota bacterium]